MTLRIAMLAVLVTGLALPAPSAFAHGNQFICARVTIGDDGLVTLELTADYGENPNIADAQEARQVLREAVRLRVGDDVLPLEHFGVVRFEEREQYGDDSPVASATAPGPHRLVTALWQTHLPGQRVTFAAKERTPLDVVMWRAGEQPTAGQSRWMLLIAGDQSPEFTLTSASMKMPTVLLTVLGALAVLSLLVWSWRRRERPITMITTSN